MTKDVCHVITLNKDVHLTTDAFLLVMKMILLPLIESEQG